MKAKNVLFAAIPVLGLAAASMANASSQMLGAGLAGSDSSLDGLVPLDCTHVQGSTRAIIQAMAIAEDKCGNQVAGSVTSVFTATQGLASTQAATVSYAPKRGDCGPPTQHTAWLQYNLAGTVRNYPNQLAVRSGCWNTDSVTLNCIGQSLDATSQDFLHIRSAADRETCVDRQFAGQSYGSTQ